MKLEAIEEEKRKAAEVKTEGKQSEEIIPTLEESKTDPLALVQELAAAKHKAGRVVNALVGKAYEGVAVDKAHGYLLLQTDTDEITILMESGLKTSPNLGERISVGADRGNGREVAKSIRRSLGR